jgi:hypothetical protein
VSTGARVCRGYRSHRGPRHGRSAHLEKITTIVFRRSHARLPYLTDWQLPLVSQDNDAIRKIQAHRHFRTGGLGKLPDHPTKFCQLAKDRDGHENGRWRDPAIQRPARRTLVAEMPDDPREPIVFPATVGCCMPIRVARHVGRGQSLPRRAISARGGNLDPFGSFQMAPVSQGGRTCRLGGDSAGCTG